MPDGALKELEEFMGDVEVEELVVTGTLRSCISKFEGVACKLPMVGVGMTMC